MGKDERGISDHFGDLCEEEECKGKLVPGLRRDRCRGGGFGGER
jgi:hypothetical protein